MKEEEDIKNWRTVVWGDWRTKEGTAPKYKPEGGINEIHITGGRGLYYLKQGNQRLAVEEFKKDLEVIKKIETEEERRIHKGFFYYHIALTYNYVSEKLAKKWLAKARDEDILTYGEKAKTFPSFKLYPNWKYGF